MEKAKSIRAVLGNKKGDRVLAAWGERCAGPGWANSPLWVLLVNQGEHRVEVLQPQEQTAGMHLLFGVSAAVNIALCREIENELARKKV